MSGERSFGVELDFSPGLNVLRAENSCGKSTCIQAIIYALGLEGMLSATRQIPLPHVMTERVNVGSGDVPVTESDVLLEIENESKDCLTVRRTVKGTRSTKLISTWGGPALTSPGQSYLEEDFFVRDGGAATRPAGFHYKLAQFIGWTLPLVTTYDDVERPLYMECIFPLLFVEQKAGWSSIQPRFPSHLRIRDVGKRVTEFILQLDAYALSKQRAELESGVASIREKWVTLCHDGHRIARLVDGTIASMPLEPTADWPPIVSPQIVLGSGPGTQPLAEAIEANRRELRSLETSEIPTVGQEISRTQSQLHDAESLLAEQHAVLRQLLDDAEAEREELKGLDRRLTAVNEDLQRNRDVEKIRQLKSVQELKVLANECPTCRQSIEDSLLPPANIPSMEVRHNISFLEQQRDLIVLTQRSSARRLEERENDLAARQLEIDSLRASIRSLRKTLVSDERSPSIAAIEHRVTLAQKIAAQQRASGSVRELLDELSDLADQWGRLQASLAKLPKLGLSAMDIEKLQRMTQLFRSQVRAYGMSSIDPDEIQISHDTYRPNHEGFDLHFDLSASDNIRAIWAFLMAFLEIARDCPTNHPGILLLDEPKQQSTADAGLASFLERAAQSRDAGHQVIVATSESANTLERMLSHLKEKVAYRTWPGRMIGPL